MASASPKTSRSLFDRMIDPSRAGVNGEKPASRLWTGKGAEVALPARQRTKCYAGRVFQAN